MHGMTLQHSIYEKEYFNSKLNAVASTPLTSNYLYCNFRQEHYNLESHNDSRNMYKCILLRKHQRSSGTCLDAEV